MVSGFVSKPGPPRYQVLDIRSLISYQVSQYSSPTPLQARAPTTLCAAVRPPSNTTQTSPDSYACPIHKLADSAEYIARRTLSCSCSCSRSRSRNCNCNCNCNYNCVRVPPIYAGCAQHIKLPCRDTEHRNTAESWRPHQSSTSGCIIDRPFGS